MMDGSTRELLATPFNRDPDWLELVDPSPLVEVADLALGDSCHLVTQKAWRNGPGHTAGKEPGLLIQGVPGVPWDPFARP